MDMQTGWNENRALLRGTAAAEPVLSHETHGVVYETFPLAVRRLSGSEDRVNVLVPRALLEQRPVTEGDGAGGGGGGALLQQQERQGQPPGDHPLRQGAAPRRRRTRKPAPAGGVLCKPPVVRRTPLGRDICDLMLAVNRRYGRADYLPCIAWAPGPAVRALEVGTACALRGGSRARAYTQGGPRRQ